MKIRNTQDVVVSKVSMGWRLDSAGTQDSFIEGPGNGFWGSAQIMNEAAGVPPWQYGCRNPLPSY